MNNLKDLWQLLRPLQWLKNGFVFTGIIFGSQYGNQQLLWSVILTAIAFCLVSSSVYILNDIIDQESDRNHPKKQFRPIPSGRVSIPVAIAIGLICCISGLLLAAYVSKANFLIIGGYLLLNIAYTFWLKHVVILDVFCIATGFMLRILSGTIGVGIPPSNWLLLCGLMLTLFLGFAKRRAELITLKENKGDHRQVLERYNPQLLNEINSICVSGAIITYSMYTMSPDTIAAHHTSNLIFTVPPVIYALFRYLYLLHHHRSGGDPTHDIVKDPHILGSIIVWMLLLIYFFL